MTNFIVIIIVLMTNDYLNKSIIQDKTPNETWESPEAPDTTHLVDSMMKRSAPSSLGKTTSHTSLGKTTSAPQTLASR